MDDLVMRIELSIDPDTFDDGFVAELTIEIEGDEPRVGQFSGATASELWHSAASSIAEVFGEAKDRDAPTAVQRLDEREAEERMLAGEREGELDEFERRGGYE